MTGKSFKESEETKSSIDEYWFQEESDKAGNLTCNKPLDLVIALDSSESIREANWSKLVRFTKAVVKTLDPTLTRLSVIRYNTNAEVPIPLGFFQNADAFGTTLDNVFYEPGGTRTDVALSKALAVFASGGQRRASKVLLVVTDNPTNDIRLSKDSLVIGRDLVEKPSESLKSYEVITFGVGVKYGLTGIEQTDLTEELKMITLDRVGDKRVVEVADFDALLKEANNVAGKICLVNGGWSSWSPWSQCTASCGGGTKVRLRRCDNPIPVNNGTNCTELAGSTVETAACNIYPCTDGLEVTTLRPLPFHPAKGVAQNILFSRDCPNGFDYVVVDANQMSASSVYTRDTGDPTLLKLHGPGNGRLYNVMNAGSWCAEHTESLSNNQEQYIQIDLKLPVKIAKVGTQGQASLLSNNWVTFFKFNYSEDGRTWKCYNQTLKGNVDRETVSENVISPPVTARYVRFNPQHWNARVGLPAHDICMRVGVFTCTDVKLKKNHKTFKRTLKRTLKN
ncbi:coadhesin-like [Dendronephthya gigantea]|uniref:coadhesin-like n=1 Tax=Dendronephthya gigantea TaxID=151771 RepID=UPI00106B080B|nr:coadhesin-like [Dendronephthya gigantea]